MRYAIFLTLLLFSIASSTYAQITLSGKIMGKADGRQLANINILLPDLKRHAVTNGNGDYQLKNLPAGKLLIRISSTGYTTLSATIDLSENTVRNFTLEQATNKLNEVVVLESQKNGYRSQTASAGPLGNLSLKDIPFSINVTSGQLIENRDAHTLSDALQTNPTVAVLMVSNTYSSLSRMTIRGFTAADQNELRDGMTDRSFTLPPIENVERIEVLNGLSAFMYGFSEAGGAVNFISKQPTPYPLATISVGEYGGGINYVHADLGGTVDSAKRLGYRFNVYREDGDTYIHGGKQARTLVSGVLDYLVVPGTQLKADIYQQDYNVHGLQTYFLPADANTVPEPFDPTKQYGQSWTYNESEKTLTGISLDSKLNDIFHLRAAYRYGTMWRKYSYIDAGALDNMGNYQETYWDSPRQYETTNSAYVLMDADFHTGRLIHHLNLGFTGTGDSYQRGANISKVLGHSNIDSTATYAIPAYATVLSTGETEYYSNILISDRMEFNKSLTALVGANYAGYTERAYVLPSSNVTGRYDQHKPSPSLALVFKPQATITIYVSYMQGLNAGGTAPTTAVNANQVLPPDVSDQYEAGIKATFGMIDLTAALFRISEVNEYLASDNVYTQDGREVHKGLEVTATGKITNRLTFIGGFTQLNARIDNTNNPAIKGKIPLNVPEQEGRAYLEYALPGITGLTISGGENFNGKRPATSTNTAFLSSSATTDAGLRYQPGFWNHKVSCNINVSNVFNKAYWINYRSGDGLELGTPRMLAFTLKASI